MVYTYFFIFRRAAQGGTSMSMQHPSFAKPIQLSWNGEGDLPLLQTVNQATQRASRSCSPVPVDSRIYPPLSSRSSTPASSRSSTAAPSRRNNSVASKNFSSTPSRSSTPVAVRSRNVYCITFCIFTPLRESDWGGGYFPNPLGSFQRRDETRRKTKEKGKGKKK